MAKDKKKSKKTKKKGVLAAVSSSKAGKRIKAMTGNAQIGDVVAAALVATAAALKDSNKARRLAASAGDELTALSKKGAEQGNAMWQLALDIGQRAMDSILGDQASRPGRPATRRKAASPRKAATARKAPTARKATTARKAAGPRKTATAKKAAAPRATAKKAATPRKTATAPKRTSRPTGRTARKRTQPKPN